MKYKSIKTTFILLSIILVLSSITSVILLPNILFPNDYSTVVLDRNNKLLGAKIANDDQWRFQSSDSIPYRFKTAIIAFEDRYFYQHPGINPISIFYALIDNIKSNRIKRGGSTISMQVIRLSRKGKERTILQKAIESFLTIGLEASYSKEEILNLYCSNAPFGGNIVGLSAASWRFFGHPDHELSWAEAATLAVLPNSPSLINVRRNRDKLEVKRNRLLLKLLSLNKIDSVEYKLALLEDIPVKAKPLPNIASHLVEVLSIKKHGEIIKTTIDFELQSHVKQIAEQHIVDLSQSGINNAAILVVTPEEKEILAYIGNVNTVGDKAAKYRFNNMVTAKRSSGSILKPFLYAAMNNEGSILPNSLVRDIPSYFNDYHPENYNGEFQGAVPASKALSQSLNVPAVYMLQNYGVTKFLHLLRKLGFSSLSKPPSHYGLSLILGGGEVSLFELVNAYAGMASTLISYDENYGLIPNNAYGNLMITQNQISSDKKLLNPNIPLSAASIWLTYKALKQVNRPETETGWESYSSSTSIAWKTGTSHGFKDAWAIGTTADFVVGVWVGNANGEGRKGLTGSKAAAPILFDIFNILNCKNIFYPPYDELFEVEVCAESGDLASQNCMNTKKILATENGTEAKVCSYHKIIFTDKKKQYRLSQECASISDLNPVSWFILPPVQEYYYKKKHPQYNSLPPYAPGCGSNNESKNIEFIYPTKNTSIYVAIDETQNKREIVFEISHHYPKSTVYWHLDKKLIGITNNIHQLPYIPEKGKHLLTVVDENGESAAIEFNVVR